jgi:integrase
MAKGLTALAVENAKAGAKRREITDGRGLFLVVQPKPSGAKSWCFRYRRKADRRPCKFTLDGVLTLAEARAKAAEARRQVEQGADPAAAKRKEKAAAKQAAIEREGDTVEHLAQKFIELHAKRKNRSWRATKRMLDHDVLPRWRGRTVHDIRKRDINTMLDAIAVDRPILANRVHAVVRKFFNWCVERDILSASPCVGVKAPSEQNARDRVLSDDEIVALWNVADDAEPFLKLLLLTGQRRTEVADMAWSEIKEGERIWTIPGQRTKNKKEHDVPVSRQAWDIIASLPEIDDHVLACVPNRRGYDRIKKRIDARLQFAEPWNFHDVRRSVATGLQKLGVRLEVTEAILNHTSGSRSGIVGIYQRHDWKAEKAAALQAWGDRVEELVTGQSSDDKVVQLDARR